MEGKTCTVFRTDYDNLMSKFEFMRASQVPLFV